MILLSHLQGLSFLGQLEVFNFDTSVFLHLAKIMLATQKKIVNKLCDTFQMVSSNVSNCTVLKFM